MLDTLRTLPQRAAEEVLARALDRFLPNAEDVELGDLEEQVIAEARRVVEHGDDDVAVARLLGEELSALLLPPHKEKEVQQRLGGRVEVPPSLYDLQFGEKARALGKTLIALDGGRRDRAFDGWRGVTSLPQRAGGETMPSPNLTLDVWRAAAVALCEYACGFGAGRSKDDAVYKEVTEGRDGPGPEQRKRYSSCGDLAHWFYSRLGIREAWVNRSSDGAFGPWLPGANVAQLWGKACPIDLAPPDDPNWVPGPGDVVLIWNTGFDAHVMVSLGRDGANLRTANYGAGGMSPLASPGAKIGAKPLTHQQGKPFYGTRQIQRYLPLADAIKRISVKPDLSGVGLSGEEVDAIELGWKANLA